VPRLLAGCLGPFVARLLGETRPEAAIFAVHPGGPRIVDEVQRLLGLGDAQVAESRAVLRDYGNLSSATLPHIWMRLLADPAIRPGTPVASLAFGPGLTLAGGLFTKV
jgi:predicted naringenin-chalcone synthase